MPCRCRNVKNSNYRIYKGQIYFAEQALEWEKEKKRSVSEKRDERN